MRRFLLCTAIAILESEPRQLGLSICGSKGCCQLWIHGQRKRDHVQAEQLTLPDLGHRLSQQAAMAKVLTSSSPSAETDGGPGDSCECPSALLFAALVFALVALRDRRRV